MAVAPFHRIRTAFIALLGIFILGAFPVGCADEKHSVEAAASPSPLQSLPPTAGQATETPSPVTRYVTGDRVRVREQPSLEGTILTRLSVGTAVQVLEAGEEWSMICYGGQNRGYISSRYLGETPPSPTPVPSPSPTPAPSLPAQIALPHILVYKGERQLELYDGETLCGRWPVALGWAPTGDKEREGDGRTPEGTYYVCTRNGASRFYLSLGLSYPNKEDADRGLAAGTIDQSTRDRIAAAIDRGEKPPWNTGMGGEIMLHGNGSSRDWTAGCIALEDEVMDILWRYCGIGVKVTILP